MTQVTVAVPAAAVPVALSALQLFVEPAAAPTSVAEATSLPLFSLVSTPTRSAEASAIPAVNFDFA